MKEGRANNAGPRRKSEEKVLIIDVGSEAAITDKPHLGGRSRGTILLSTRSIAWVMGRVSFFRFVFFWIWRGGREEAKAPN